MTEQRWDYLRGLAWIVGLVSVVATVASLIAFSEPYAGDKQKKIAKIALLVAGTAFFLCLLAGWWLVNPYKAS